MTKQSKQKSKQAFVKQFNEAAKQDKSVTEKSFTDYLVSDVQARVAANVFGFDKMHPTTYLNQQRWHDDIVQNAESKDSFTGNVDALNSLNLGNTELIG